MRNLNYHSRTARTSTLLYREGEFRHLSPSSETICISPCYFNDEISSSNFNQLDRKSKVINNAIVESNTYDTQRNECQYLEYFIIPSLDLSDDKLCDSDICKNYNGCVSVLVR